ncbi:MerR family transcriptional regulator [Gorillibacterium massiliense]|uniref:MerR family transcriptional regulator n=1 Tax=Gorillibacterium massiliense TaxID=1280390 RepID=UPI0004BC2581|nr:MerR family transcriptional regulator [Gorillibacterium massiliense]
MELYRIGELAKMSGISQRTIDYYTNIGLIQPAMRTESKYRYYDNETLERLQRIEALKRDKYTLEEIRQRMQDWDRMPRENQMAGKLAELEAHLRQVEMDIHELDPLVRNLKPKQARQVFKFLKPQTAACIEALLLLIGNGSPF